MAKTSQILVEPHLIDAEFRMASMPFFCRSGHPVVTVEQFLHFVDPFLPQEPVLYLPVITGQDLSEVAEAQQSTVGGLEGWAWNEIKSLPLAWFSGLAILLEMVETTAFWPQGLLDAYDAMIRKVDGDSTPLGQGSLCVYLLCIVCGPPLRLVISGLGPTDCLQSWEWCVVGCGVVFPLHWILRKSYLGPEVIFACHGC